MMGMIEQLHSSILWDTGYLLSNTLKAGSCVHSVIMYSVVFSTVWLCAHIHC